MTPDSPALKFLSTQHIADQGGPSPKRQAKLRCAGEFCEFVKIGGRVYYPVESWEAFINTQRRRSTSETPAGA